MSSETKVFDLDDPRHDEKLKQWSKLHWTNTIKKSLDNSNAVTYHDCCFCFSKRGYSRKWSHPQQEALCIAKMPSFKAITTEEEFSFWLRDKMIERTKKGMILIFPSINIPHLGISHPIESFSSSPQTDFLKKRCLELSEEKQEALSQLERLKADNTRLYASTKSWFDKYQEAIKSKEESLLQTPVKKKGSSSKEDIFFMD